MKEGVCLSVSVLNLKLKLIIQQVEQVFLAAKRSSTPALVLCLSVRLSVVKTEFLTVWSAYDN